MSAIAASHHAALSTYKLKSELNYASMATAYDSANKSKRISSLFDSTAYADLPKFEASELNMGNVIGRGGFCVVRELKSIKLIDTDYNSTQFVDGGMSDENSSFDDVITRESIAKRVNKKNKKMTKGLQTGGYCIKLVAEELSKNRKHRTTYKKGTVDLLMESKFLSSLSHESIIKIHGMSGCSAVSGEYEKPFVILERLHETFAQKLKVWTQKDRQAKSIATKVLGKSKMKEEKLLNIRLQAAYDIANVMSYLHSKNIIFRDLKPDNIGFDGNDNLKIFDFGLAKELRLEDMDRNNGCYKLTGFTGAIRYMAPEVGLKKPYNLKADVYSWSILMWYIMALEPPYDCFSPDMFIHRVFKQGARPMVREKWSSNLCTLMKNCWQSNIDARPSFAMIKEVVRYDLVKIRMDASNHTTETSEETCEV